MSSSHNNLFRLILSAMFLALALILPFITGQIPKIGNMLCPMHFPVLLCGFFCGPVYAFAVGFTAPLLRFLLFGMPVIMPTGIAMSFELAVYGLVCALAYRTLPQKKWSVYASLILSMLAGRLVWGVVRVILYGLGKGEFGWKLFLSGAFVNALPGIMIQIIFIPLLVLTLQKYTVKITGKMGNN